MRCFGRKVDTDSMSTIDTGTPLMKLHKTIDFLAPMVPTLDLDDTK